MTDDDGAAAAADPESALAPTSMTASTSGAPSFQKLLAPTAIILLVTGAILYGLSKWWGSEVLSAGYIGVMFLAPAVRVLSLRGMVYATGWAAVILTAGVLIGGHGPWAQLGGIVATAIGQGMFVVNGGAGLSRSPASFLGFSKFADSGGFSDLWQPLVGLLIAAVAVSVLGAIAFGSSRKHPMREPLSERIYYGVGLAVGCSALTAIWAATGWGALSYALLVFCLIYAYDAGKVVHNSGVRVAGAMLGIGSAVLVSWLLPTPGVIVAFVVCGILAVANVLTGHHFWYVVFLVAAVVHLADVKPGASAAVSAEEHIIGVVVAAAVAVALHWAAVPLHDRVLKPLLPHSNY